MSAADTPTPPIVSAAPSDADLADALGHTQPPSGSLGEASRAAAVAAALPLVATYFVSGAAVTLAVQPRVAMDPTKSLGQQRDGADVVLGALRLRVALVTARRLSGLVRLLSENPNFRYQHVAEEHVGQLRGRLDLARHMRSRGRISAPRSYPVHVVRRDSATPENVLAAYALKWMRRELEAAHALADPGPKTPETVDASALRAEILRLYGLPNIAGAMAGAERVSGRGALTALIERVDDRIATGHVAKPDPYKELSEWVRQTLAGEPALRPGDIDAAFYDGTFDTRLFELWCVSRLVHALEALLGPPVEVRTGFAARDRSPRFRFAAGSASVEVYFQGSLATLAGADTPWRYVVADRPFVGIPDIGVRCIRPDRTSMVLIDAKLRQRTGPPSDELYKLLGYFANTPSPADAEQYGAVVFHAPTGFRTLSGDHQYTLRRAEHGIVEAVGVDPGDATGSQEAFAILAALVLRATGVGDGAADVAARLLELAQSPSDDAGSDLSPGAHPTPTEAIERQADAAQTLAVAQLLHRADAQPPGALDATVGQLRTVLGASWECLGPRVQRMLTSAVHFGSLAPEGADMSGPVLGLCAGVERILREGLVDSALAAAGLNSSGWTLGRLLHHVADTLAPHPPGALKPARDTIRLALSSRLAALSVDLEEFAALLPAIHRMRTEDRNPAAHGGLRDLAAWQRAYTDLLITDAALVPRTVGVLRLAG